MHDRIYPIYFNSNKFLVFILWPLLSCNPTFMISSSAEGSIYQTDASKNFPKHHFLKKIKLLALKMGRPGKPKTKVTCRVCLMHQLPKTNSVFSTIDGISILDAIENISNLKVSPNSVEKIKTIRI